MISYLKGRLTYKDPAKVIVEVGGIGYEVHIPISTYSVIKDQENIQLATYLLVREDAHILYGFGTEMEKAMFQHLISVSGIGPASALLALSFLSTSEIRNAIVKEDVRTLQSIKGIGGKTAQRIILELKDKLRKEIGETGDASLDLHNTKRSEALKALLTLGINKATAEKNIDTVLTQFSEVSLEELIKLALKNT